MELILVWLVWNLEFKKVKKEVRKYV
jgi:hypothetical protein